MENASSHAISQGLLLCAMKAAHNMTRAKVATTMRKKPQEHETKWNGDRPQAVSENCGIFGVYLEELTVDGAWGSALEASVAAEFFKVSVVVFTKEKACLQQKWSQRHHLHEVPRETLDGSASGTHAGESCSGQKRASYEQQTA